MRQSPITCRPLAIAGLLVTAAMPTLAIGATVVTIPFSSSSDFTNNFRTIFTTSGSTMTQSAALGSDGQPGTLRFQAASASSVGVSLYDANASAAGLSKFGSETVQADFRISQTNGSFGILLRVNDADTAGYAVVINVNSGTGTDQIRLFDASGIGDTQNISKGSVGSSLGSNQSNNSLDLDTFYTLRFTATNVNNNTGVQLNAAVYALGGSTPLAGMSLSALDTASPFLNAGQVGVRTGSISSSYTTLVDNFTVPEPAAIGSFAGMAGLTLLRRRRA